MRNQLNHPKLENSIRWEAYTGSPHFGGGDRRQDFDNGWDEAIDYLRPLLEEWAWGSARGEATDLAEETDYLLQNSGATRHAS